MPLARQSANKTAKIRSDDSSISEVTDTSCLREEGFPSLAQVRIPSHPVGILDFSDHPVHEYFPSAASKQPQSVIYDSANALSDTIRSQPSPLIQTSPLPEHVRLLYEATVKEGSLSDSTVTGLHHLLSKHADTFATSSKDLGFCSLISHDIDTGTARPIKQPPRRPPLAVRAEEDRLLDQMLQADVIEPSKSEWASPVCLVRKKDGSFRFCVDYRKVNALTKRDAFPVPGINDSLDSLQGNCLFASCDLLCGYWQLPMTDRAKERGAFCTRRGLFQFKRMPFGLSGAPSTFCRLMSRVFADLLWVICLIYIDDLIIFARTEKELLERLDIVFTRLHDVGLKLKTSKCCLFKSEIEFLGHLVSGKGIEPVPSKLQAIKEWPRPHCIRDVRAFYGLSSYYRKFIRGFATIAEPLTRLVRKNAVFQWSDEAEAAFNKLKEELMAASTLAFPRPGEPCLLDTDASDVAYGAVLSQMVDGQERPIAFFSRVMNTAQKNYCPTRRELLAVVASLQHFRHHLLNNKVILRTDHNSLKGLRSFKRPEGILARWMETLAEFDLTIEHRPGRLHCNADGVSRPICKQCYGKLEKVPWVDELERSDELTEPLSIHALELQPELSDSDLADMQMKDLTLLPVINALTSNANLSPNELKLLPLDSRNLLSQRPMITLLNGILIRQKNGVNQLVVPTELRRRLFQHVHAGPLRAHLGNERTLKQLQQAYYWPGMRRDVVAWHRLCEDCALSKGPLSHPQGKLEKVLTGAPLDIVAIDILSKFPVTADGSKYLLVLTDYFTKWSRHMLCQMQRPVLA